MNHRWKITLLLASLVPCAPASAQEFLTVTLARESEEPRRPEMRTTLDGQVSRLALPPRERTVWFAPSVGLDVLTYTFDRDIASVGLLPSAGVGLRFRPSEWDATDVLLAVDFYTRLLPEDLLTEYTPPGTMTPVPLNGDDYMSWDLLGVTTFFNVLAVGFGARLRFPLQQGVDFNATAIFTVGIHTSTSGRTETRSESEEQPATEMRRMMQDFAAPPPPPAAPAAPP